MFEGIGRCSRDNRLDFGGDPEEDHRHERIQTATKI